MLFLILLSSLASASEFSFNNLKASYSPGETFQSELSIQVKPEFLPQSKDITLEASDGSSIRIAPFMSKLKDNLYFISFDLPLDIADGTYSVVVENMVFMQDGKLKQIDQQASFDVASSSPILSISPSFFTSGQQLNLEVISKAGDAEITIEVVDHVTHIYSSPQKIFDGKARLFKFTLSDKNFERADIKFSYGGNSYLVPVYNFEKSQTQITQQPAASTASSGNLEFIAPKESLVREIAPDIILEGPIKLRNSGSSVIDDVKLSFTGDISGIASISMQEIASLAPQEEKEIILTINSDQNPQKKSYSGSLLASSGNAASSYPITITFNPWEESQPEAPSRTDPRAPGDSQSSYYPPAEAEPLNDILNLTGEEALYEEPAKVSSSLIVTILTLIAGIAVYYFSRKKTQKKSFSELVRETKK